jgi:diguanylate cyclase (GGDEF)-like protein
MSVATTPAENGVEGAPAGAPHRAPVLVNALKVALAMGLGLYVVWLALGPHHLLAVRDDWLGELVLLPSCVITLVRGLQDKADRPWLIIGIGMSLWTTGDFIYTFWVQYLVVQPPATIADAFYICFYPCMYLGLVLLLRQRVRQFHPSVVLDGLLVALGVAAYGSLTLKATLPVNNGLLGTVVNTAYPLGDLLLLVLTLGVVTLVGWRAGRAWGYLLAGCGLFAVADTTYLVQGTNYHAGTILDAGWPAAMALLAVASWSKDRSHDVSFQGTALLALPSAVALLSVAFLVASSRLQFPFGGVLLASAALLAVLVRGALTFHEVAQLAESRRQAHTDELTGLANRRHLYKELDALMAEPACPRFAVLLLDLDRFKEVNDALGHGTGDQLLHQLGAELTGLCRQGDLVARLGGDEFAVVLGPGSDALAAGAMARRILSALSRPFTLHDISLHVEASVGIALYPDHGATRGDVLRCADVAMYKAKRLREGFSVYSADTDLNNRDRLLTTEQLRAAVSQGQLVCYFQPKVDVFTARVVGAEALVRWEHPTRGVLLPADFLPLAEQTGLMGALFAEVLDQALGQCRRWQLSGHNVRVSVNLAAANLLDVALREMVRDRLAAHQLSPGALDLEITEEGLMADPDGACTVLEDLVRYGSGVSLDDYGTGYNSLASLQALPVKELKLDRMFVTGMAANPKGRAIVAASVALASALDLDLVAEGVETEADWDELVELGVGMAQGYWISRPVPPDEFVDWLNSHHETALPPRLARVVAASPTGEGGDPSPVLAG